MGKVAWDREAWRLDQEVWVMLDREAWRLHQEVAWGLDVQDQALEGQQLTAVPAACMEAWALELMVRKQAAWDQAA